MIILGLNAFHGDLSAALIQGRCARRGGGRGALPAGEALGRLSLAFDRLIACAKPASRSPMSSTSRSTRTAVPISGQAAYSLTTPELGLVVDRLRGTRGRARPRLQLARAVLPDQRFAASSTTSSIISRTCPRRSTSRRFEEAVVVSVDGFGDFASTAWGRARAATLSRGPRLLPAFARASSTRR